MLARRAAINSAYRIISRAIDEADMKFFDRLDNRERRWLIATYTAVLAGLAGGLLDVLWGISVGSSILAVAAPIGLIFGLVTTILVNCKRSNDTAHKKRDNDIT